jgi:PiT family inorganic phosphate transporter
MATETVGLGILLAMTLLFAFLNGLNDSSGIVAAAIASNSLEPRRALLVAAVCDFAGPFLFGIAVAEKLGRGLLEPSVIRLPVLIGALAAAIVWSGLTAWLGIPSSSSHALIGGLLGGGIASGGLLAVHFERLARIVVGLIISPPLGMLSGYVVMRIALIASRGSTPRVNGAFRRMQLPAVVAMGLSHGANDGPKAMALIGTGLMAAGRTSEFRVPVWAAGLCAGFLALGTSFGGWRSIRTLGGKIYRIRPLHAFASQLASAGLVVGAAEVGAPVSATQVVSSAIMGVGGAERANKVRWSMLNDMAVSWSLTIPATAVLSIVLVRIFDGMK